MDTPTPVNRLRRLRRTEALRKLQNIPLPGPEKFIWPVFVTHGEKIKEPIEAMPGQFRYSIDSLLTDLQPVVASGIGGVLLFELPPEETKNTIGSEAWNPNGLVPTAIKAIKNRYPELIVATDVCLCAYTTHGHCGTLNREGDVDNDKTIANLAKIALNHAQAGADIVAPSAMMDGQVKAIRNLLDANDLTQTIIMSYSTKFASSMYGPFRDAEKSAPTGKDRQGYQQSYANKHHALQESIIDEQEGADILMVKPSLFYLDIIHQIRETTHLPLAAYNVSGEYAMLIATANNNWGDLKAMVRESITAIQRAGADIIISYWANQYDAFFC